MTHPHAARIRELVAEAITAADTLEHEWDEKALDWPLTADSVVYEVGSYKGRWALQMARRYDCVVFCFEPQEWAWDVSRTLLADYEGVRVLNYGLGIKNGRFPMGEYETDGASFVRTTRTQGYGLLREIGEVVRELDTPQIDLMLLNIEGYEYILIPHMLALGIKPKFLMVQCHDYGELVQYEKLMRLLTGEYERLWDYGRTLSAWQRKDTDEQ